MATQLSNGHRVKPITVRELLQMFGAERRGFNKVQEIRSALENLGLVTEPDFESAWIDQPIRVRCKRDLDGASPAADVAETEEDDSEGAGDIQSENGAALASSPVDQLSTETQSSGAEAEAGPELVADTEGIVETVLREPADPTFRIGSLATANKALLTVEQNDPLRKAVTMMLQHEYSQLPIMHGQREVKGMITWRSIALRYSIGGPCSQVQHCRADAQVVDANGRLFDAIPTIVSHGYILVRANDRRITGIVTASDLSLQFQQLAEPFLLLREIELHIRHLLQGKVTDEDFALLGASLSGSYRVQSIDDLSFGGYIRLLQRPDIWARLALNIDQGSLVDQLDKVRRIRNDVMHFDPDPLTRKQLNELNSAAKFMQCLYELRARTNPDE